MFFIYSEDERDEPEIVYIGEGLEDVKVDDGLDEIESEYGVPEEREEMDTTLWLSYRDQYGLDFLLTKDGDDILEIRINEGFEGKTEEGIGIGDNLDDVFLKISDPLLSVDANWEDTHENARGGDRVLYNQVEAGGNVLAFKYIDQKKGVLFWADSDRKITQIVVFKPYEENTVVVFDVKGRIFADTDTVTLEIISGWLLWDRLSVMVDGKIIETNSSSTSGGHTASFYDPDGEFDPDPGVSYTIKIINISKSQVVWEDDVIATVS